MNPIRTLIVDDEPLARRGVRVLLDADPEILVVGEYGDADAARMAIDALAPDLVFVDVQMPEESGLELARSLPAVSAAVVVFVTAYGEHALDAFEVHALDYVVKPIDEARFARTLTRAKTQVRRMQLEGIARSLGGGARSAPEAKRFLDRFPVRTGERTVLVPAAGVDWIEAVGYHVRIHAGSEAHLLRQSLSALEAQLDPSVFQRVHRSAIVRLEVVAEIRAEARGRYTIVLQDGTRLPLSRRRREQVEARLARRI